MRGASQIVILCFRVPTTSVGARSEGSPQLSFLTPSSLLSPLSIPGSLKPSWGLRKPPACSPCSQNIPGSLEPSWGLRKPPANFPCSQLAPLTPTLLPLLPEHPWIPETFLEPQEVPSLLPSFPPCFPCSQSISEFLKPSWSLRKFPACSPHSQLAPLAPRASLDSWNLPGASGSSQLVPLTPTLLPLLPEHLWIPGTFLEPQEVPSLFPSLPPCSPCS